MTDSTSTSRQTISPAYTKGQAKKINPEYVRLCKKRSVAKGKGDMATYRELGRVLAKMPSQVSHDPDYRRLKYVRYADDFLLGFVGPKREAEAIKDQSRGRSCAIISSWNCPRRRP